MGAVRTETRRTLLAAKVRSSVPAAVVPLVHRLRLRHDLRTPRVMAQARTHMEFLVGKAQPESDVDALAREYVAWTRWRIETRWHPDVFLPPVRVEGVENLEAGRGGAIVNFLHHGPYESLGLSLAEYGHHMHLMIAPWFYREDRALWLDQHRLIMGRGCTVFPSTEGADGVRRRLTEGELVTLATDMPGRTPVTFVGRELLGTFGAARLAHELSRPVLVVTSHRDAAGAPFFRVHEPLRPEQFEDAHALLRSMLAIHEPAVVAWPASYEEPRSKWGTLTPSWASPHGATW